MVVFFHVGATMTPLVLSRFFFGSTLGRTLKGGKQYTEKSPLCTEKQSMTCACGSALYDLIRDDSTRDDLSWDDLALDNFTRDHLARDDLAQDDFAPDDLTQDGTIGHGAI